MASSTDNPEFEKALEDFKSGLKKKDRDQFGKATLPDLLKKVEDLQKAQHAKRRGQNLALLKPFIEAMEQFGKIVEIFTNASQFVAYVWVRVAPLTPRTGSPSYASYYLQECDLPIGTSQAPSAGNSSLRTQCKLLVVLVTDH